MFFLYLVLQSIAVLFVLYELIAKDQTFYASTFERKEWDLDKWFIGSDITFSMNGNEENFEIKQILE